MRWNSLWSRDTPDDKPTRRVRVVRTGNLVAAASIRAPQRSTEPDGSGGDTRRWQRELWSYYDEVGPGHYAARFVGSCLSRMTLTVALPDTEGNPGPVFETVEGEEGLVTKPLHPQAEEALALVRELRSPRGGQSQVLRSFGVNLFIAGEGSLVGIETDETGRTWEVLSIDELRVAAPDHDEAGIERQRYQRVEGPGATPKLLPPSTFVLRVWQPHPRFTYLADSSLKAVRDICEEIILLTREIRGQTLSRLAAAGILIIPEEIKYGPKPAGGDDEDDESDDDPFTDDLIRTMTVAIAEKSSAAAVVPFVLRIPAEYCALIRHIKFERPMDDRASEKRTDATLRLAQGIDLPVEVVTGHAGTTFSNAWQIDESLYKAHIEPLAEIVADALTEGYLRTNLPGTPLMVWFDPGELVARPDRSGVAKDAHDRYVISNAALRRSSGFTDADAPDEKEVAERIDRARAVKGSGPLADQQAGAPQQNGNGQLPPGFGPTTSGDGAQPADLAAGASPAAVAQVAIVADFAAIRAVDHAGARLKSKANGGQMASLLRGIPNREVAATLGPATVRTLVDEDSLFRGQFDMFRSWAARLVGAEQADVWTAYAETQARKDLYTPRR